MAKAKVEYTIKAKDESRQGIQSATQNVDRLGGAIQKAFSAAAITAAAVAIKKVGTELITAYGEQEAAERRLQAAASNNPYLDDQSVTNIQNYASELQKLSTVGDEVAIAQASMLAAMGLTEDQITTTLGVAADLSAGLGIDLNTAVRGLGQTFEGTSGQLGRYVPQLRNLTEEQLRAGEGVEMLREQFNGMAAELADTTLGAVQQFQNAWGDFKEVSGEMWANFFTPMLQGFTDLIEKMTETRDAKNQLWEAMQSGGAGMSSGDLQSAISAQLKEVERLQGIVATDVTGLFLDELAKAEGRLAELTLAARAAATEEYANAEATRGATETTTALAEATTRSVEEILAATNDMKNRSAKFADDANKSGAVPPVVSAKAKLLGKANGINSSVTDVSIPDMGIGAILGDLFGGLINGPIGALITAMDSFGSIMQLLSPGLTILQGLLQVIDPIINEALAPFVEILTIIGQIAGQLLLPVLKPIAWAFKAIADAIYGFIKFVVKAINALIPGKRWDIDIPKSLGDAGGGEKPTLVDDSTGGGSGGGTYSTGRTSYNYVTITAEVVAGDGGLRELAMMIRGELEALDAIGV